MTQLSSMIRMVTLITLAATLFGSVAPHEVSAAPKRPPFCHGMLAAIGGVVAAGIFAAAIYHVYQTEVQRQRETETVTPSYDEPTKWLSDRKQWGVPWSELKFQSVDQFILDILRTEDEARFLQLIDDSLKARGFRLSQMLVHLSRPITIQREIILAKPAGSFQNLDDITRTVNYSVQSYYYSFELEPTSPEMEWRIRVDETQVINGDSMESYFRISECGLQSKQVKP